MIKKTIKKLLLSFNYEIRKKLPEAPESPFTMNSALKRSVSRGLQVNTVIDVGASDGRWSKGLIQLIPDANYLLVEAQEAHREPLERFKDRNPNINYVIAAAGSTNGNIYFDNSDLFGGVASEKPIENGIIVPVISLDEKVAELGLDGPYLLKLDTHGFEVPILEGARKLIKNASLIILETYNYRLTDKSLRYWEMCNYMEDLGFLPVENVDLLLRQKDNTFWQMDTFFLPSDDPAFASRTYS